MTNRPSIRSRIPGALVSFLLAAVFVLFFGECNTPLGPRIGSDNAMYLTMGTALAQGYAPYSDIFDHKGPLLFILQMLPQLIAGGYSLTAVYWQEVVFLFAGLRIVSAMARRSGMRGELLLQLIYLGALGACMDGGNLTEEYAATFILAGLYAAQCVFDRDDEAQPKDMLLPAAVMGAAAMLAFLTRANNALGLCGMTAGIALTLLFGSRFAALGACAAGFLAGCAAAGLPVLAWLAYHGAISDAVYGSIIHNMMYAETGSASRVHALFFTPYGYTALLFAAVAALGALRAYMRSRRAALPLGMLLTAALAGMSCFISHKFYSHYLMVLAPIAVMGAVQILAVLPAGRLSSRRTLQIYTCVVLACVVLLGARANHNRLKEREGLDQFIADAQELYALVPEEDRDSFMAYRVEPKWYVAAQALPCMRFYFLQEILGQADPAVMDEVANEFETNPPQWVVIFYNREFGPPYDERVAQVFESRYTFVDAKGQYQLLRLTP
ncbi:MAG: hypothetical protein J6K32_04840 [Clostridia bacterium]|nr:hypothetical protein [Clostridia bacterium]